MKMLLPCATLLLMPSLLAPSVVADTIPGEQTENSAASREKQLYLSSMALSRRMVRGFCGGQEEPENRFRPRVNLRLGAVLSPEVHFSGGLDFPLDSLRLSRDFSGRLDIDFLVEEYDDQRGFFFGNLGTSGGRVYVPITLNQVYVGGLRRGGRVYDGFGVGAVNTVDFFRSQSFVVGKVFVGSQFNARSSAELGVTFSEDRVFTTLQFRLGL